MQDSKVVVKLTVSLSELLSEVGEALKDVGLSQVVSVPQQPLQVELSSPLKVRKKRKVYVARATKRKGRGIRSSRKPIVDAIREVLESSGPMMPKEIRGVLSGMIGFEYLAKEVNKQVVSNILNGNPKVFKRVADGFVLKGEEVSGEGI